MNQPKDPQYNTEPSYFSNLVIYSALVLPFDLIATLTSPFRGYEKYDNLTIDGAVHGKIRPSGSVPTRIEMEMDFDSRTTPVEVQSDGTFMLPLAAKLDLRDKKMTPMEIKLTLPWKKEFESTGRAFQPAPDAFVYALNFSNDGQLEIKDSIGKMNANPELSIAFTLLEDKKRQSDIAKEKADNERREKKEAADRTRTEQEEQQRRHNQRLNCAALDHFHMTPMALEMWLKNKCDELVR
jgi:hypothetical protein